MMFLLIFYLLVFLLVAKLLINEIEKNDVHRIQKIKATFNVPPTDLQVREKIQNYQKNLLKY